MNRGFKTPQENIVKTLNKLERPRLKYRIKQESFGNGEIIFTPEMKETGFMDFLTPWQQIVKIYDEYVVYYHPGQHNLTKEDCEEHIKGYQEQENLKYNAVNSVIEHFEIAI